jgi:preprotein translocase subunit YajC
VWPFLITLAVLAVLVMFSQRRRRRQIAEQMVAISQISFGDEVMTTSGLYGTVVGRNDDGTVQLAIAPGVVVKWAVAALRTPETLSERYRRPITHADDDPEAPPPGDDLGGGA